MREKSQENIFLALTGTTFFVWWSGIAGSQIYLAPALIWTIYILYLVVKGDFSLILEGSVTKLLDWCTGNGKKIVLLFVLLNCLFWTFYILVKYYSFNYHTFDTGIYHNIVYNLSYGEFFSSFHNVNFLGNHFNINLVFLSPLYKIYPHSHWVMLSKVSAYLACTWFIWKLCQETLPEKSYRKWALVLIILWLFLYKPVVNSVRYEFQGSSLSLPFIFYAFLCLKRENWVRFGISLVFLAGFKEHLASVWIGFGCYLLFATHRKKLGIVLIILGIMAIYVIFEQIMPWARDYAVTWRPDITPFNDVGKKALYGIKLILPFAFLPLIFWRKGIMAGPAIGINLISHSPTMYTSHYHYDDVASCLLFIATILAIDDFKIKEIWQKFASKRWFQAAMIICLVIFVSILPKSNLRFIRESLPKADDLAIIEELKKFDEVIPKSKRLSVLDVSGIYFNRRNIQIFNSSKSENCVEENRSIVMDIIGEKPVIDYIVLPKGVGTYNLDSFDQCVQDLKNSDQYKMVKGYQHLIIFKHVPE